MNLSLQIFHGQAELHPFTFPELIRDCNNGFGLKDFSEEAVEACDKLIRKYCEHLARKFSLTSNARDIFVVFSAKVIPFYQITVNKFSVRSVENLDTHVV